MQKKLDVGLLLVRLAVGFPMLVYGISKLFNGIDYIQGLLQAIGLPAVLGYGVFLGEVVAPLLIIIGYRTRIAAIIFAINCLTAILLSQSIYLFKLNDSGGWALELLAIYFTIAIALFFTGGGKFSVSGKQKWD